MRTLRLLRNISTLIILGAALLFTRPGAQLLHAYTKGSGTGTVCVEILPGTYGYNCTFNADGTCSSSECQGQTCSDMVCSQACGVGNKPGWDCGYDATGQCTESRCKKGAWECSNSGCE